MDGDSSSKYFQISIAIYDGKKHIADKECKENKVIRALHENGTNTRVRYDMAHTAIVTMASNASVFIWLSFHVRWGNTQGYKVLPVCTETGGGGKRNKGR